MLDAQKAFDLGFADRILEPVEFVDESIAYALELVETPLQRTEPDHGDIAKALRKGRSQADDAVHGAARAPYVALDLIEGAVGGWSLQDGYRAEEEAIADLIISPATRRSLYAFDLVERRAKKGVGIPDVEAAPHREGRHRRRRLDGDAARNALPEAPRRAARDPRPRPGDGRPRRRVDPRGARRPLVSRRGNDEPRRVRRLRS